MPATLLPPALFFYYSQRHDMLLLMVRATAQREARRAGAYIARAL